MLSTMPAHGLKVRTFHKNIPCACPAMLMDLGVGLHSPTSAATDSYIWHTSSKQNHEPGCEQMLLIRLYPSHRFRPNARSLTIAHERLLGAAFGKRQVRMTGCLSKKKNHVIQMRRQMDSERSRPLPQLK